jgi:hypothetical protein
MGRNYIAEQIQNPLGLNNTKGKNYVPDILNWVGGQLVNPLGLNDSDRWDNRLGGGPRNTAPLPSATKNKPGSKPNDAAAINKRLKQRAAETEAVLKQTKGHYDHSSGSFAGQTSDRQILPAEETRPVPGGGTQTGKNLGGGGTPIDMNRTFSDLLAGVGQVPFGSTQLPTTMGNPYTATYKQTAGFGDEVPDIGGMNGATYDSAGGSRAVSATNLQDMAPFNPGAPLIEGGSERIAQQATGISSGRLSDALAGVKTQEANREMTPERRQLMARAAFLDGGDSMSGLRAKEAVNNVVYAGGQHYIPGESADSPAVGIDRSQARDISSGKTDAQSLLAAHILKNKEGTPAEAQAPLTTAVSAVKDGFAAGAQTDFALNNGNAQTNKPGQKTIDSDFMESADFSDPAVLAEYERRMNQLK